MLAWSAFEKVSFKAVLAANCLLVWSRSSYSLSKRWKVLVNSNKFCCSLATGPPRWAAIQKDNSLGISGKESGRAFSDSVNFEVRETTSLRAIATESFSSSSFVWSKISSSSTQLTKALIKGVSLIISRIRNLCCPIVTILPVSYTHLTLPTKRIV